MRSVPRTMVHQLHVQADRLCDRPALWTKRAGAWVPTSWREYAHRVKRLALAFIELGLKPGQAVGIIGFNREEWVVSALAATAAGGVPVGLYTTSSPDQLEYVVGHCAAPIVVVENEAYLATFVALRSKLPALEHLVVMAPAGSLPNGVHAYTTLLERGAQLPDTPYHQRVEALRPDALGSLIYTSGTTGRPKGVMLTHRNLTWTVTQLATVYGLGEGERLLSYLPLSHIAEQTATISGPIATGMQVFFAESFDALGDNLRQVRPTVFFGVPRVWEKFKAKAEASLAAAPVAKRRLVAWARGVALRYHRETLEHRQPTVRLLSQYALAKRLVFAPLKQRIGLDQGRVLVTSAAPIAKEVLEFFASLDLVVRELYGQSEVTGPTSANTEEHTRLGTLGKPMAGVAVRIANDGEILVSGDNVCAGYFKEPEATAELIQQGWLHSGDVGELDSDGFLRITGRKKEIIITAGGKKTPPSGIEGLLREVAPVSQALVVGDRRPYLVALITLDPDKLRAVATELGIAPDRAASNEALRTYLNDRIEREVNSKLSRFEAVKRFVVLPKDFSVEGGELTPTLKVKRAVCEQKYAAEIAALYEGA